MIAFFIQDCTKHSSFFEEVKNMHFCRLVVLYTGNFFPGGVKIYAKNSGVTLYRKLAYTQVYTANISDSEVKMTFQI